MGDRTPEALRDSTAPSSRRSAAPAKLGTYTYTTPDQRAPVVALDDGLFGDLAWVEQRTLAEGPQAFVDLDRGASAAAKIVLVP